MASLVGAAAPGVVLVGGSVAAAVAWGLGAAPGTPTPWRRPSAPAPPAEDLVTIVRRAVEEDRYERLWAGAEGRLAAAVASSEHRALDDLPSVWRRWLGRPSRGAVRAARLRDRVRAAGRRAAVTGSEIVPRLDVWNSDDASRAGRRSDAAALLTDLGSYSVPRRSPP